MSDRHTPLPYDPDEDERGRQERLKGLIDEEIHSSMEDVEKAFGPGSFGCHEALHTASIALDFVERNLLEHPSIILRPDWYAKAGAAFHSLWNLYQAIGAAHLTGDESDSSEPEVNRDRQA